MQSSKKNTAETFESMRTDYQAAKAGRFRRRRVVPTLGAGGDFHYRMESDFLRIMEYSRDMERNDAVAGPLVNQAVLNMVQNGLVPDPKTGDTGVDQAIKDRWWSFATNANQCSLDGEMVYRDIEKMVLRRMFVDGDIFAPLTDSGSIELVEGHRCRTPRATSRNVVHGVLLDDNRKPQEYWFTKEEIDPTQQVRTVSQMTQRPVRDQDGHRVVIHLKNPKRSTQTRGVSAYAPVFDMMGMHEDLQFAKLVQQQVVSCIAFIRERTADYEGGKTEAVGRQVMDAAKRVIEEIAPGMEIRGAKGEKITGFSPAIPNAEFFQQMRSILQLIGINLGIPLVLLLMDASDTNFSGWRGAMDQARMGFRDMQQHLIDHFETPVYLWKLRQFAREDAVLRAFMEKRSAGIRGNAAYFNHEWHAPRWPYIQPYQDAQADDLRQRRLLSSPKRIHAALAQDVNDVQDEVIADNKRAIVNSIKAAKEIETETGEKVTWRELLFLTDPDLSKPAGGSPALPGAAAQKQLPPGSEPPADAKQDPKDPEDDARDPEDKPGKETQ